jgi:hypothetical protein
MAVYQRPCPRRECREKKSCKFVEKIYLPWPRAHKRSCKKSDETRFKTLIKRFGNSSI